MEAALSTLRSQLGSPPAARAAAGLLRQLANSAGCKGAIVAGGGLELLNQLAAAHAADAGALEQVSIRFDLKGGVKPHQICC